MSRAAHASNLAGSALVSVDGEGFLTVLASNGVVGAIARTGAGVYTVALNDVGGGVSREEHDFIPVPQNGSARSMTVTWESEILLTVRAFDAAGAGRDSSFTLDVCHNRRRNN